MHARTRIEAPDDKVLPATYPKHTLDDALPAALHCLEGDALIFTALRAIVLVFGINALASLLSQWASGQRLEVWFLLHQQQMPGALFMAQFISAFTYALCALAVCWAVAHAYWRELLPPRIHWLTLAMSAAAGLALALFINHSVHVWLFSYFFGDFGWHGGQASDSFVSTIFDNLPHGSALLTFSFWASALAAPFIEELTDRGIFFKEAERLPLVFVALLSVGVFCAAHIAGGGLAKALALVPAALLFASIRMVTGSFVYSTAAHMALNIAALLHWRVV